MTADAAARGQPDVPPSDGTPQRHRYSLGMSLDDDLRIEHDEGCDRWRAYVGGQKVAHFEFVHDDAGRTWLSEAETSAAWQRQGIGRRIIAAAVAYYDEVWASIARPSDGPDSDTRYLTEEGAALVNSCIRLGIMKASWVRNPYYDDFRDARDAD